jgi:hypothetical protein
VQFVCASFETARAYDDDFKLLDVDPPYLEDDIKRGATSYGAPLTHQQHELIVEIVKERPNRRFILTQSNTTWTKTAFPWTHYQVEEIDAALLISNAIKDEVKGEISLPLRTPLKHFPWHLSQPIPASSVQADSMSEVTVEALDGDRDSAEPGERTSDSMRHPDQTDTSDLRFQHTGNLMAAPVTASSHLSLPAVATPLTAAAAPVAPVTPPRLVPVTPVRDTAAPADHLPGIPVPATAAPPAAAYAATAPLVSLPPSPESGAAPLLAAAHVAATPMAPLPPMPMPCAAVPLTTAYAAGAPVAPLHVAYAPAVAPLLLAVPYDRRCMALTNKGTRCTFSQKLIRINQRGDQFGVCTCHLKIGRADSDPHCGVKGWVGANGEVHTLPAGQRQWVP